MSTVTIDTEWVRRKVDYKFGDETAFDVDEIISECVVAPVAPDPGLREAIANAIKAVEHNELVDLGYVEAITNAVLAVLAERGVR